MAFLGGALGLVGSLFGGHNTFQQYENPQMDSLLAASAAERSNLTAQTVQQGILGAQSQEQDQAMIGQSTRAVDRTSALAMIVSRHEGLMQSIQQAENSHVKSAFDIVKQS